jgi:hypothetical protein
MTINVCVCMYIQTPFSSAAEQPFMHPKMDEDK